MACPSVPQLNNAQRLFHHNHQRAVVKHPLQYARKVSLHTRLGPHYMSPSPCTLCTLHSFEEAEVCPPRTSITCGEQCTEQKIKENFNMCLCVYSAVSEYILSPQVWTPFAFISFLAGHCAAWWWLCELFWRWSPSWWSSTWSRWLKGQWSSTKLINNPRNWFQQNKIHKLEDALVDQML